VLVFVQIFFLRQSALRPALGLAEIIGLAVILRGAALLVTPGLIGIDVWVHIPNYAASIREAGQLGAIAHSKYFGAPLYHLLVVVAAEAFHSTLRTALYATVGVVMPLSTLLLYYTTERFLPVRWALFAAAAFAIADRAVLWSIHLIPTSMGVVFFIAIVYGTATIHATRRSRGMYALVLLFAVATVLTHQISTFVLLVFLGAGTLAQLYVRVLDPRLASGTTARERPRVNFAALLAVTLPLTVIDWSVSPPRGPSFLEGMLATALTRLQTASPLGLRGATTADTGPIDAWVTTVPLPIEVIYSLGMAVLLCVSLAGAFALLGRERLNSLSLTWIVAVAVMLFVALGMPLLGLYFLIPSRWIAFVFVPMILLGAFGLRHLEMNLSPRRFTAVLLVFTLLYAGPMLVDHKATIEEPVFDDAQLTPAYSESELDAARTISTIHPEEERIHGDRPYYLLLRDWHQLRAGVLDLNSDGTVSGDHVVHRTKLSEGSPKVGYRETTVRAQLPVEAVCRPTMEVVYSNGDVRYCRSTS